MSDKILLVMITGSLTRLEHFPEEIFCSAEYDRVGLSFDEYNNHDKNWQHPKKVCVINVINLRCPDIDLGLFDAVFVLDEESIDMDAAEYIKKLEAKFCNPRVFVIVSGFNYHYVLDRTRIYVYPYFLQNVAAHSKYKKISPLQNACRKFDVLLGMSKPHRDFVFDSIAQHNMLKSCYVSLTTNRFHTKLRTIYRSPELQDLELPEINETSQNVLDSYAYINDQGPRISHIIPWEVYDHSLYSIVAETNWCDYTFLSEKTAKALFAKRIFVMFSSPGTMRFIRDLGFRTFDEVLDESYDNIPNDQERWSAAWQQVLYLGKSDPKEIYQHCQSILDHNHNHIQNRSYFLEPLVRWMNGIIKSI